MVEPLPIDAVMPEILARLAAGTRAVLAAPPGAGKTTRVPLALMAAPWATGRILVLEPRRIAARAAAERMAESLGEPVGTRVGYRIRGEARTSAATRIEVVTEGILTRLLQDDAELPGVAAVLFDEIHERSIHADLGLALCLEVQASLRPDLRLIAMSATLDTARLGALMDAPVIASAGRAHPVETRYLTQPWTSPGRPVRFEDALADLVLQAWGAAPGDALVFVPGVAEITRLAARLAPRLPGAAILALHGGLGLAEQRAALRRDPAGRRRVVLATAIAETSVTLDGVALVIDGGRARRAETDPATALTRLVTRPVSRAEAEQRRGRAGRQGPGVCYRLWTRGEEGALPAQAPPEILTADLAPLALDLAVWGARDPGGMAFLDPPPGPALAEARALLADLGALDGAGRVTAHGRALARQGAHPRLGHMILTAAAEGLGPEAALIAAALAARDPFRDRRDADLAPRLAALANGPATPEIAAIRAEARALHPGRADPARLAARAGALLALAYPDRIAQRRPGEAPRYLLAGGRGAVLDAGDPLARIPWLVAADLSDARPEAVIRRAAILAEADLRALHAPRIVWEQTAEWSRREGRVLARRRERLGALVLADQPWTGAAPEALAAALVTGIAERGLAALPWSPGALALRARSAWARRQGHALPDWSDEALTASLADWLAPHLGGQTRIEELARLDLAAILATSLTAGERAQLAEVAPETWVSPLGARHRIDYDRASPTLTIRVQELFGLIRHPVVGRPGVALVIELTSPAGRPVQTTADLPGFWATSYAEVRRDLRARYPRHPWPEDPTTAPPTNRAKPRGT